MQRMSFQFITGTEQLRKISLCYIVRYLLFSYYIQIVFKKLHADSAIGFTVKIYKIN